MPTQTGPAPYRERPAKEALSECKRELKVRERCYRRWIDDGKLSETDAADRLERLWTAINLLDKLVSLQPDEASCVPTTPPAP